MGGREQRYYRIYPDSPRRRAIRATYPADEMATVDPTNNRPLLARYDLEKVAHTVTVESLASRRRTGGMWRWAELLPVRRGRLSHPRPAARFRRHRGGRVVHRGYADVREAYGSRIREPDVRGCSCRRPRAA